MASILKLFGSTKLRQFNYSETAAKILRKHNCLPIFFGDNTTKSLKLLLVFLLLTGTKVVFLGLQCSEIFNELLTPNKFNFLEPLAIKFQILHLHLRLPIKCISKIFCIVAL